MALIDRLVALAHYNEREFGLVTDYSKPPEHLIPIAYSTTEDEEHELEVTADIYEMKVFFYYDGRLDHEESWSEEDWITNFEDEDLFNGLIEDAEYYSFRLKGV